MKRPLPPGYDFQSGKSYRFKVGARVLCNTQSGYEPGRIIKLGYSNPGDPTVHPYQVQLNNGKLIYCPWDDEECCKEHIIAWWEDLIDNLMGRQDLNDEVGEAMLKMYCRGKDVNATTYLGDACLHACVRHNWMPGIKALLELLANPNLGGQMQQRPLNMAVQHGAGTVNMLLAAYADPTLQDEDPDKDPNFVSKSFQERQWHRSALHYAAMSSKDLTMMLLDACANINQADAQCKLPLHLAIEENLPDVVDLLLANGANVHAGNMSMGLKSNPLLEAAYRGDVRLMSKLILARSDINLRGKQSMTPLHMAARGRHLEAVKILVEARADINIEVNGKTAGQLAAKNGATEIASVLGHKIEALELYLD